MAQQSSKTSKRAAQKPAKAAVRKPAKSAARKPAKSAARKPAKSAARKPTKAPARKPTRVDAPDADLVPRLSAEQLLEVLGLLEGADTVELKLSVPDTRLRSTVTALGMDPLDAQIRQVTFFDTPELTLNQHGVVVRARRVQNKPGDSVVKLRPVKPDELPESLRSAPGFGVEVDTMPGGFVCSGSMKAQLDDALVKDVFAERKPIRKLFSKHQRALFKSRAPEGVDLDALTMLGPVNVLKLKFRNPDYPGRLVAELWFYPDNTRILELSTKCLPGDTFHVVADVKAFLATHGVDLGAPQQTKTKTALEYFAGEVSSGGTGAA